MIIRDHLHISLLLLSELSELIVYYTPLNHQKTVDFTYGLKPVDCNQLGQEKYTFVTGNMPKI